MTKIETYKEGRFSQIRLPSGERIMLSVAQSGIAIFKIRFLGLVPGRKIVEWSPEDMQHFVRLLGGAMPDQTPFKFTVDKLASFASITDLEHFLSEEQL